MFAQTSSSADPKVSLSATGSYQQQSAPRQPPWVELSAYPQVNYDSSGSDAMSSDGRYPYHHPHPGIYEYTPYHPHVYDTAHYPPTHQQLPTQPQRPPIHLPNYHPQYPSVPPSHYGAPQWNPENWPHYVLPQQPPPSQSMQDPNLSTGAARPDMPSSAPVGPNRYLAPTQVRQSESSISGATQPLPDPQNVIVQDRVKPQANEPPSSVAPATSTIDFLKLLDSYRLIMDSSNPYTNEIIPNTPGRSSALEILDKMIASAAVSFTMLDTGLREMDGKKAENSSSTEQNGEVNNPPPATPTTAQSTESPPVQEGQTCLGCKATSTPEWRRGPMGPRTLCNACGLVYAKLIKKRGREARAFKVNGNSKTEPNNAEHPEDSALLSGQDGGSDDDDDDDDDNHSSVDES